MLNSDLATDKYFPRKNPTPPKPVFFSSRFEITSHIELLNLWLLVSLNLKYSTYSVQPHFWSMPQREREMIIQYLILHVNKDLSSIISFPNISLLS